MSNFLENKQQANISKFGGEMLSSKTKKADSDLMNKLKWNFLYLAAPLFLTSMLGTITYPFMVRIARSKYLFRLRNFYSIHLSIAPVLAFIHINFFSFV